MMVRTFLLPMKGKKIAALLETGVKGQFNNKKSTIKTFFQCYLWSVEGGGVFWRL
jgi:hypothetical protein